MNDLLSEREPPPPRGEKEGAEGSLKWNKEIRRKRTGLADRKPHSNREKGRLGGER